MNESHFSIKAVEKQNNKVTICTIVLVLMSIMIYVCLNVVLPFLNGETKTPDWNNPPSPITMVENQDSGEQFPISTADLGEELVIPLKFEETYEPKDYTLVDNRSMDRRRKTSLPRANFSYSS